MTDLLLTFDFPPLGGGISRMMAEIAARYPAGDLIVSTGTLPGARDLDAGCPNRVDRITVPSHRLRTLGGLVRWSRRVMELERSDGIRFAWCGNLRPSAYPAWWLATRRKVPYGVFVYGGDLLTFEHNFRRSARKRALARRLLGGAAVFVAISGYARDLLVGTLEALDLGHLRDRIRVVPLGTDPVRFHPAAAAAPVQRDYRLPSGRWLLTVARLVPHKGVDVALQAFAALLARHPDLRYAVVGDGGAQVDLRRLAERLGVADRVHFIRGATDAELPAWYALADVYVGLSRPLARDVEGFGIAFLEASATGKPVVAGRSGGVPDAVQDGVTGLLVDPTDAVEAAAAIDRFLSDPIYARQVGRAGRREVERYFNWDRVVRDVREISASVVATAARR